MSIKAFIKNEQKKRSKDTEVAPLPADTAAEAALVTEPPAADGGANSSDVKPLDDGVNEELEKNDIAPADNINAAPGSEVWQAQLPSLVNANQVVSGSSQRRQCGP